MRRTAARGLAEIRGDAGMDAGREAISDTRRSARPCTRTTSPLPRRRRNRPPHSRVAWPGPCFPTFDARRPDDSVRADAQAQSRLENLRRCAALSWRRQLRGCHAQASASLCCPCDLARDRPIGRGSRIAEHTYDEAPPLVELGFARTSAPSHPTPSCFRVLTPIPRPPSRRRCCASSSAGWHGLRPAGQRRASAVAFATTAHMNALRYLGLLNHDQQRTPAAAATRSPSMTPRAAPSTAGRLARRDAAEMSVLVHEVVHHLQHGASFRTPARWSTRSSPSGAGALAAALRPHAVERIRHRRFYAAGGTSCCF